MCNAPNFFIYPVTTGLRRKRQNDWGRKKLGLALFERSITFINKPSVIGHTYNLIGHLIVVYEFFEFLTR